MVYNKKRKGKYTRIVIAVLAVILSIGLLVTSLSWYF